MIEKQSNWPSVLLGCFPKGKTQRLRYVHLYWFFFAPLCVPTHCFRTDGTTVGAYCTAQIRSAQKTLLRDYLIIASEAAEHARAVRNHERYPDPTVGTSETRAPTPADLVRNMRDRVYTHWPEQNPQNVGAELIRRSAPRFLSAFAQEPEPCAEQIRSVLDYYALCVRCLYPEPDDDAPLTRALCEQLRACLKDSAWRGPEDLPSAPAGQAAYLLLAFLFLHCGILRSSGSVPDETRRQLRAASLALGFVDLSAQELSRVSVSVDVQDLQDICTLVLARPFQDCSDTQWLCGSIAMVLQLLKTDETGETIQPGFDLWLETAERTLMEHDRLLFDHYNAAPNEAKREIFAVQELVTKTLTRIRRLRLRQPRCLK